MAKDESSINVAMAALEVAMGALRAERQRLGEQAVALLQQNAGLREQIQQLKTDDRFLEALARRELGMTRPDEVVYRFRRPPRGMTP